MSLVKPADPQARVYQDHAAVVLKMLRRRFPNLAEDQRLELYHDAWERMLRRQRDGALIRSPREYLLDAAYHLGLDSLKRRWTTPVAPDSRLLATLGGGATKSSTIARSSSPLPVRGHEGGGKGRATSEVVAAVELGHHRGEPVDGSVDVDGLDVEPAGDLRPGGVEAQEHRDLQREHHLGAGAGHERALEGAEEP